MSGAPEPTGIAVVDVFERFVRFYEQLEQDANVADVLPEGLSALQSSASLFRAAAFGAKILGKTEAEVILGVAGDLPFSRVSLGALQLSNLDADQALPYLRWIHGVTGRLIENHMCQFSTSPMTELEYALRVGKYLAAFTRNLKDNPEFVKLIKDKTKVDLNLLAHSAPPAEPSGPAAQTQ